MAALEFNPENAVLQFNLGLVHKERGDLAAAEQSYLATLEIDPQDADSHFTLGTIHEQPGNLNEAVSLEAALEMMGIDPEDEQNELL